MASVPPKSLAILGYASSCTSCVTAGDRQMTILFRHLGRTQVEGDDALTFYFYSKLSSRYLSRRNSSTYLPRGNLSLSLDVCTSDAPSEAHIPDVGRPLSRHKQMFLVDQRCIEYSVLSVQHVRSPDRQPNSVLVPRPLGLIDPSPSPQGSGFPKVE